MKNWPKRILLFFIVNALVVAGISILTSLLGLQPYLAQKGIDYSSLIIFCLMWGMGGAFISLAISRMTAKWMMGVRLIDPMSASGNELQLLESVHRLSRQAGLSTMPEVGIYDSAEVNAFATGPTRNRALVAVSSGLLAQMSTNELEGVLGHEVAHIANGDMVTMTLIQGIVNALVMFLARIVAFAISALGKEKESTGSNFIVVFVLEIVFMFLGSIVVAWFSRQREYRADLGGANLAGRPNMISALEGLRRTLESTGPSETPAIQALKISSQSSRFMRFFSTHPSLEDRIHRLRRYE